MILRYSFAVTASLLAALPFIHCLSPSDIPADTPISTLVASANSNLAQGNYNDALTYFDIAVSRDPRNYLTLFKRGATYLSLGKNALASRDFDKVLAIKPDFEGALLQRARIKSKNGDWDAARKDYEAAGKAESQEVLDLQEAQGAASLAAEAAGKGDWESCISHSGVAIMVAGTSLGLRQLRATCRFERGEIQEGVSDLNHVLQMSPGSIKPHLQISAMLFYSLGDTERGLAQMRKCLHSDPDSKPCSKMFRREKVTNKALTKVKELMDKRQMNSATKLLVPTGEDSGLIQDIRDEIRGLRDDGTIHANAPNDLLGTVLEMTCEAYTEMNNHKKAEPFCTEALTLNPDSLAGLIAQAHRQIGAEDYEAALSTLKAADEKHPGQQKIQTLHNEAQVLLKRSKQKDYYKVLGVSREADARTIKHSYRKMTKQFHPDKAHKVGITKEDAEKKMASINEAYEVLSNPELKARFDAGDDPNSQEQQGQPFQGSPFGHGAGGQQFFFQSGGGGQQHFKFQQQGFQFPGGFQFA